MEESPYISGSKSRQQEDCLDLPRFGGFVNTNESQISEGTFQEFSSNNRHSEQRVKESLASLRTLELACRSTLSSSAAQTNNLMVTASKSATSRRFDSYSPGNAAAELAGSTFSSTQNTNTNTLSKQTTPPQLQRSGSNRSIELSRAGTFMKIAPWKPNDQEEEKSAKNSRFRQVVKWQEKRHEVSQMVLDILEVLFKMYVRRVQEKQQSLLQILRCFENQSVQTEQGTVDLSNGNVRQIIQQGLLDSAKCAGTAENGSGNSRVIEALRTELKLSTQQLNYQSIELDGKTQFQKLRDLNVATVVKFRTYESQVQEISSKNAGVKSSGDNAKNSKILRQQDLLRIEMEFFTSAKKLMGELKKTGQFVCQLIGTVDACETRCAQLLQSIQQCASEKQFADINKSLENMRTPITIDNALSENMIRYIQRIVRTGIGSSRGSACVESQFNSVNNSQTLTTKVEERINLEILQKFVKKLQMKNLDDGPLVRGIVRGFLTHENHGGCIAFTGDGGLLLCDGEFELSKDVIWMEGRWRAQFIETEGMIYIQDVRVNRYFCCLQKVKRYSLRPYSLSAPDIERIKQLLKQ